MTWNGRALGGTENWSLLVQEPFPALQQVCMLYTCVAWSLFHAFIYFFTAFMHMVSWALGLGSLSDLIWVVMCCLSCSTWCDVCVIVINGDICMNWEFQWCDCGQDVVVNIVMVV